MIVQQYGVRAWQSHIDKESWIPDPDRILRNGEPVSPFLHIEDIEADWVTKLQLREALVLELLRDIPGVPKIMSNTDESYLFRESTNRGEETLSTRIRIKRIDGALGVDAYELAGNHESVLSILKAACDIMLNCYALQDTSGQPVILQHGDLKPEHLLADKADHLHIIDWASCHINHIPHTIFGSLTPEYSSLGRALMQVLPQPAQYQALDVVSLAKAGMQLVMGSSLYPHIERNEVQIPEYDEHGNAFISGALVFPLDKNQRMEVLSGTHTLGNMAYYHHIFLLSVIASIRNDLPILGDFAGSAPYLDAIRATGADKNKEFWRMVETILVNDLKSIQLNDGNVRVSMKQFFDWCRHCEYLQ